MQWDFAAYSENCYLQFGVTPQEYLVEMEYGGKNISAISNIVFRYKYSRQINLSWLPLFPFAAMGTLIPGLGAEFWNPSPPLWLQW